MAAGLCHQLCCAKGKPSIHLNVICGPRLALKWLQPPAKLLERRVPAWVALLGVSSAAQAVAPSMVLIPAWFILPSTSSYRHSYTCG